ncbi:hypothetical protein AAG747_00610 [Rapidithrix thailandica]|uniref:Uncharacterized protein n=1 Tax=Rapidithrix thailandica TaxID=413964 RepID=A0AAW9S606_9BACT
MMAEKEHMIQCPKCEWQPDGGSYWSCECGQVWNTFATYGKCPSCSKVHRQTQCPMCHEWSPHPDWYLDLEVLDISVLEEKELEK